MICRIALLTMLMLVQGSTPEKGSGKIRISEQILVNGVTVSAGDYEVVWQRDGFYADVKMSKERRTVVELRGRIFGKIGESSSTYIITHTDGRGNKVLKEIHLDRIISISE